MSPHWACPSCKRNSETKLTVSVLTQGKNAQKVERTGHQQGWSHAKHWSRTTQHFQMPLKSHNLNMIFRTSRISARTGHDTALWICHFSGRKKSWWVGGDMEVGGGGDPPSPLQCYGKGRGPTITPKVVHMGGCGGGGVQSCIWGPIQCCTL